MTNNFFRAVLLSGALATAPAFAATPDGLITAKTKLSLWTTGGVRSDLVHVDTNDGVVTLYGKVPSDEQKAKAEQVARNQKDVREVKNLLQVVPADEAKAVRRADKELKAAAEKGLKADAMIKDSSIKVKSVDNGVVLLAGKAKTFSDHLRAISVVDRIPGVSRVASEVEAPEAFSEEERYTMSGRERKEKDKGRQGKKGSSANDMRISTAVKLKLWTTPDVPSTEIAVDTTDGVVYLSGRVPSDQVKVAAAREAGEVDGVVRVENALEVAPPDKKAQTAQRRDEELTRDVLAALKSRPELKNVEVSVKNGTVRLTGTVGTPWDEVSAVRVARQVPGVRDVDDDLEVEDKPGGEAPRQY